MSDAITITGTRDGIDKAVHEIQLISDEQVVYAVVFVAFVAFSQTHYLSVGSSVVCVCKSSS